MRFLLHPEPGPRVAEVLRELGHAAAHRADVGLSDDPTPPQVIEACRVRQHELLTASREFLDAVLPTSGRQEVFGRVIVYLQDRPEEHELAIHRLFERYKRLAPGRLYTVTGGRVKVRQLPSTGVSQLPTPNF